jgi:hypothetical protein
MISTNDHTKTVICTSISSFPRQSFGLVMKEFGSRSGVRTIIVKLRGLLRRREVKIVDL